MKPHTLSLAATTALLCFLVSSPALQAQRQYKHQTSSADKHLIFDKARSAKGLRLAAVWLAQQQNAPNHLACSLEMEGAVKKGWSATFQATITNARTLRQTSYKVKKKTKSNFVTFQEGLSTVGGHLAGDEYVAEVEAVVAGAAKVVGAHMNCDLGHVAVCNTPEEMCRRNLKFRASLVFADGTIESGTCYDNDYSFGFGERNAEIYIEQAGLHKPHLREGNVVCPGGPRWAFAISDQFIEGPRISAVKIEITDTATGKTWRRTIPREYFRLDPAFRLDDWPVLYWFIPVRWG